MTHDNIMTWAASWFDPNRGRRSWRLCPAFYARRRPASGGRVGGNAMKRTDDRWLGRCLRKLKLGCDGRGPTPQVQFQNLPGKFQMKRSRDVFQSESWLLSLYPCPPMWSVYCLRISVNNAATVPSAKPQLDIVKWAMAIMSTDPTCGSTYLQCSVCNVDC